MAVRGLQDILQNLSKAKKKNTAISKHGKHLNMEKSAKNRQNKSQDNLCRLLIEQIGR